LRNSNTITDIDMANTIERNPANQTGKIRISMLINKLVDENNNFMNIDKYRLIESLSNVLKRIPLESVNSITDNELSDRLKKIMLVEVMSKILSDLPEEQVGVFDKNVKRREFFK